MTRTKAAYLRAVKHHLAKWSRSDAFDQSRALAIYETHASPRQAAFNLCVYRDTSKTWGL